jgi:phosphoserine phosphatase
LEQPIPYRSGKVDALASHGVKPALAFGDSMTDLEMLRSASLAVVIDRERIPHGEMTNPPDWQLQPPTTLELRVVNSSPHQ